MTNIYEITDSNYKEIIQSTTSGILFFYTPWCGVCKVNEYQFREIAEKYSTSFFRVNAELSVEFLGKNKLLGYPTIGILKNGSIAEIITTTRSATVEKLLEKHSLM